MFRAGFPRSFPVVHPLRKRTHAIFYYYFIKNNFFIFFFVRRSTQIIGVGYLGNAGDEQSFFKTTLEKLTTTTGVALAEEFASVNRNKLQTLAEIKVDFINLTQN